MIRWDAPESFAEYVRQRHVELLRFAYVLTGQRSLADDLVQDALERTGISWKRVQRTEDPEGYIRRIIVNRYLNTLRAFRREILVDIPQDVAAGKASRPEGGDEAFWRMLDDLPRKQRAVLVLRFYLDMSDNQIAGAMNCSVSTVRSNAARAIGKLRKSSTVEGVREVAVR
jgi:RNA polymerase sigma-70 factor (sigma-E family)